MFVNMKEIGLSQYCVTNVGEIYSLKVNRKLTPRDNNRGYSSYNLKNDFGELKNYLEHRLVALTFIENDDPKNKVYVNHIDGNKQNNCISNLEWNTCKENAQHAVNLGLTTFTHSEKEVSQIDLVTGCVLRDFKSLQEAETITGVARQNISKVVRGLRTKAGNFGWKYK